MNTPDEFEAAIKAASDRFIERRAEIDAEMRKLDDAFNHAMSEWRRSLDDLERRLPELLQNIVTQGNC